MSPNLKALRDCASLLIVAKSNFNPSPHFNYRLLCLKRSSKLKFLPNSYVFPGGTTSEVDSSMDWLKIFKKSGYDLNSFKHLIPAQNVPSIFKNDKENILPKFMSLRICAIRETFEECGILICRSHKIKYSNVDWVTYYAGQEVLKWQHKIHDDPNEFLNLCLEFDIYPDLFAMTNWSNWITPPSFVKRFDTVFFLVTLDHIPETHPEESEISDVKWQTPRDFITDCKKKNIVLPPPQFYEISRLKEFSDIKLLSEYAAERSSRGCETYCPYKVDTEEGIYNIFPGDGLYPENMDMNDPNIPKISKLPETNVKNRLLVAEKEIKLFVENYNPRVSHIVPKSS